MVHSFKRVYTFYKLLCKNNNVQFTDVLCTLTTPELMNPFKVRQFVHVEVLFWLGWRDTFNRNYILFYVANSFRSMCNSIGSLFFWICFNFPLTTNDQFLDYVWTFLVYQSKSTPFRKYSFEYATFIFFAV